MAKPRFKIDFNNSSSYPFGLYFYEPKWWGGKWREIYSFDKRDQALAYYEKVKDLPEYLD